MIELTPRSRLGCTVVIPGSKSITHRALIAAALARGRSVLDRFLECDDTGFTASALRTLGVPVVFERGRAVVEGCGGDFPRHASERTLHVGNSGTSLRLLLSIVALARGDFVLCGTRRMHERPVGPLVDALSRLGVDLSCQNGTGCPPVRIRARGMGGGTVLVDGRQSSQYVSSPPHGRALRSRRRDPWRSGASRFRNPMWTSPSGS